jgi:DNA-binding MarR family transcriptional regulator
LNGKNGSYNSTKKRALEVLEPHTSLDVPTLAHKIGIDPVRRAYTYLGHLEKLGLIERTHDTSTNIRFQITPRGRERLARLRQKRPMTLDELIAPFLIKRK